MAEDANVFDGSTVESDFGEGFTEDSHAWDYDEALAEQDEHDGPTYSEQDVEAFKGYASEAIDSATGDLLDAYQGPFDAQGEPTNAQGESQGDLWADTQLVSPEKQEALSEFLSANPHLNTTVVAEAIGPTLEQIASEFGPGSVTPDVIQAAYEYHGGDRVFRAAGSGMSPRERGSGEWREFASATEQEQMAKDLLGGRGGSVFE